VTNGASRIMARAFVYNMMMDPGPYNTVVTMDMEDMEMNMKNKSMSMGVSRKIFNFNFILPKVNTD